MKLPLFIWLAAVVSLITLSPFVADAVGRQSIGSIKADRILFLGNSITLHGPKADIGWKGNWGMAATAEANDYVHLLASAISKRTGGPLIVEPNSAENPKSVANVINIADIFERNYAKYQAALIKKQLDWRADIVIVQCGENVPSPHFDAAAFRAGLRSLLNDLKEAGDPRIFVTSHILGSNPVMDDIKRRACEEDPGHRTFVDLSSNTEKIKANGFLEHPGDPGMRIIADTILDAISRTAATSK